MSTIAAKFSSATTKVKVGTAAVALVGAATLTPAVAQATPSFAPIAQAVGSSSIEFASPSGLILDYAEAGTNAAAPVVASGLAAVVAIPLQLLSWAGDTFYTIGNVLGGSSNFIGSLFINAGDTAKLAVAIVAERFTPYQG